MTDDELISKASKVFLAKGVNIMNRLGNISDANRVWNEYLDGLGLGIRRMGKFMMMVTEVGVGNIRVPDHLLSESCLEMTRENAEKVAVLGLP